ncbi:hypothetical protein JW877_05700, partial [bacterium]|nr:hypothetical protein [bacterium]
MKTIIWVVSVAVLFSLSALSGQIWQETFRADFEPGFFNGIEIISPDPDGMDDGALRLIDPGVTLDILIVYPTTCNPYVLGPRFDRYEGEGSPPTNVRVYLIEITLFGTTVDPTDSFNVYSVEEGTWRMIPLTFFEGILFGVSDVYGYEDLSPIACDLVRSYASLGNKVVIFTHSTVWNRGAYSPRDHPGFNSLVDIHGLDTIPQLTYDTFRVVYNVASDPLDPVLHHPFELPDTMTVSWTHRRGQVPVSGDILYRGVGYSSYYGLYFHINYLPSYHSWGAFINYGHTLDSPIEWDVKCTINTLYLIWRAEMIFGEYISAPFDPGALAVVNGCDWS